MVSLFIRLFRIPLGIIATRKIKFNKVSIILFISVVLLIVITTINTASSQTEGDYSKLPNSIIMGVRTSAELFGEVRYSSIIKTEIEDQKTGQLKEVDIRLEKIGGFCRTYGKKLEEHINLENQKKGITKKVKVEYISIKNDHLGDEFRRYNGLRPSKKGGEPLIHLECGPNTRFELTETESESDYFNLINDKNSVPNDLWKYNIKFKDYNPLLEKPLHSTGIKILVNNDVYKELKKLNKKDNKNQYKEKLSKIAIAVVKNTTTYEGFKEAKEKSSLGDESVQGYNYLAKNNRYEALKFLETTPNSAYASDVPILQTILSQGFKENYSIFPPGEEFLPDLPKQYYDIAFYSLSGFADDLESAIRATESVNRKEFDTELNNRQQKIDDRVELLSGSKESISRNQARLVLLILLAVFFVGVLFYRFMSNRYQGNQARLVSLIFLLALVFAGIAFVVYIFRFDNHRDNFISLGIPLIYTGIGVLATKALATLFSE